MRSFAILAVCVLAGCGPDLDDMAREQEEANVLLAEIEAQFPTEDHTFTWEYDSQSDPMTDEEIHTACIRSSNAVNLNWPYEPTRARLCLRNSPNFGRDAFVALEKQGQVLCRSYQDCTVRVRFDDGQAQEFSAVGASDGSSNIFFIRNRDRLENSIGSADVTAIEAEFYEAGRQAMLFDTKGFSWPN